MSTGLIGVQVKAAEVEVDGLAHRVVGVERECTGPGPNTYRRYFFRFAQYAFIRTETAFLAAALIPRRFRLVLGLGLG